MANWYNKTKSLLAILFVSISLTVQAANPDAGKALFKAKCAACHAKDMKSAATGPALAGFLERWADYPEEDLYGWIRNSQAMIKAGHPMATELWNQYKPVVMTAFELKDEEIADILAFIDEKSNGGGAVATGGGAATIEKVESGSGWVMYLLIGLLAVFAIFLWNIVARMNSLERMDASGVAERPKSFASLFVSKEAIGMYSFLFIVIGGYFTITNATNLGRQQGYAPDQPINFSHKIHAGDNKIDCKYCHDGARRSKHSVIPGMNTCMNCHAAIKVGSKDGTKELTKIYASVGYNPATGKYIEGYEDMDEETIKSIFTEWILDNNDGNEVVAKVQWDGIKSALTNEQKKEIPGAVEWVRIHNLPDHVYFNHAQHVTVGGLDCAQCHGKVEEMDVLEQHSTLGMGWCINCHRETEVPGFRGSEYYKSYTLFHEQMNEGKRSKVTVADIGGLECAKCHY